MKVTQSQQNTTFGNHTVMRFIENPIAAKDMCKAARKAAVEQGKIKQGNAGLAFILISEDENTKTRVLVIDKTKKLAKKLRQACENAKSIIKANRKDSSIEGKIIREQARKSVEDILTEILGQNETARIAYQA